MSSYRFSAQFFPWFLAIALAFMVLISTKTLSFSELSYESVWILLFFVFTIFGSMFHRFFRWSVFYSKPLEFQFHSQLSHFAHFVLLVVCVISVLSSSLNLRFAESQWFSVLGLLMLFDATIFILASKFMFHKYFQRNPVEPILITKGIYRLNRHPYYLGLFELALSCSFVFHSFAGLIGSLVLWVILLFLAKREEKHLRNLFREEYETYYKSTPGLFIIK